jgi:GxxExxY protein
VVEDAVVVEIKAVDRLTPSPQPQLPAYPKLAGPTTGLLIDFDTAVLNEGIKRLAR